MKETYEIKVKTHEDKQKLVEVLINNGYIIGVVKENKEYAISVYGRKSELPNYLWQGFTGIDTTSGSIKVLNNLNNE